jgi:hypothetical protein
MDDHSKLNSGQKGAQKYFTKTAQGAALATETRKKERDAGTAKMAKLRALRLAKEAQDKEAEELRAKEAGVVPAKPRKRVSTVKPAKMIRMSY